MLPLYQSLHKLLRRLDLVALKMDISERTTRDEIVRFDLQRFTQ